MRHLPPQGPPGRILCHEDHLHGIKSCWFAYPRIIADKHRSNRVSHIVSPCPACAAHAGKGDEQKGSNMNRFALTPEERPRAAAEDACADLIRQLDAGFPDTCPIRFAAASLRLLHCRSCGKCAPCQAGLPELATVFEKACSSAAASEDIENAKQLARLIADTADCAIGVQAARMALDACENFAADFAHHAEHGRCQAHPQGAVPCMSECPAQVDVPGYIALLHAGRPEDAVRLIRKDNPLPLTCGLVCEHPCENHCRRGLVDDAVSIRELKRVAVEQAGAVPLPEPAPSTGKSVALVGGGPASLSAAYYLRLMGHAVTLFEEQEALGGMLRYGIPSYRLPKDALDEEIAQIIGLGVDVRLNCSVGSDVSFSELRARHDAVFVGIGAQGDKKLRIPGEEAQGVVSAVELLRRVASGSPADVAGKRVVVVGGGNVAMDAARSSVRLGAESVTVAYRRRQSDMTAQEDEILGAIAEGCEILELHAPVAVESDEVGCVAGLVLAPQIVGAINDGRTSVRAAQLPEVALPCDVIIVAIGQSILNETFAEAGIPLKRDRLVGDATTKVAELEGVFAGGDCATGPSTVIKAIAAGKAAAAAIDDYLGGSHPIAVDIAVPSRVPNLAPCARVLPRERAAAERRKDFEILGTRLSDEEALQEAGRCLRCDLHGCATLGNARRMSW